MSSKIALAFLAIFALTLVSASGNQYAEGDYAQPAQVAEEEYVVAAEPTGSEQQVDPAQVEPQSDPSAANDPIIAQNPNSGEPIFSGINRKGNTNTNTNSNEEPSNNRRNRNNDDDESNGRRLLLTNNNNLEELSTTPAENEDESSSSPGITGAVIDVLGNKGAMGIGILLVLVGASALFVYNRRKLGMVKKESK